MRVYSLLLSIFLLAACTGSHSPGTDQERIRGPVGHGHYARGFSVSRQEAFKLLEVRDPWQQSRDVTFSYILGPDRADIPDSLKHLPFIQTPVNRVVAMSTTHVAMIEALDAGASIAGVSGAQYIYSPSIRSAFENGGVVDVGYGQGLDFEAIVDLNPDVMFLYGVEGNVMTILEKLNDLGIPAVFCGEYLETHPLGKAEWIRFFSLFYDKEAHADAFFVDLDSSYRALAGAVRENRSKPFILSGLPWKDTWYMAGGKSFAAQLIADAGGSYLWKDDPSAQALPLDLESVYLRAVRADIWINPGAAGSLTDISMLDERLGTLKVIENGQVWNNNARISPGGGNDYWESGTVRPDLILADLIAAFHPGLLPDHSFVYYRKLK
jgi:iron complex transport system substrate-binding protein